MKSYDEQQVKVYVSIQNSKIQISKKKMSSKKDEEDEENKWDPYKEDKELGKQMEIARDIFLYGLIIFFF
jgi:hypothetical protein